MLARTMASLALKSILFHWRQSLSLAAGIAIAAAVMTGALIMGDSVRHTLLSAATSRLGKIEIAVGDGGGLFPDDLTRRVGLEGFAPILSLRGVAIARTADGQLLEVPGVQVFGIDGRFRQFADTPPDGLSSRQLYLNQALASRLGDNLPESISVRIPLPSDLPTEAPLVQSSREDSGRLRGQVAGLLSAEQLGNFSLAAEQQPRPSLFLPLADLQRAARVPGKVNLFLGRAPNGRTVADIAEQVANRWQPEDYGLQVKKVAEIDRIAVTSDRIFIPEKIARVLAALSGAELSLTYLVNEISETAPAAGASTPYSFVQARGDQVAANSWLAEHLGLSVGDEVSLDYYRLSPNGGLEEAQVKLRIETIDDIADWKAERQLWPSFPGLTDVDTCRAWDVGMPMEEEALKDEANEAYWQQHGPTPKLRVPLTVGQKLWGNRYGHVTAASLPVTTHTPESIEKALQNAVAPSDVGLPIRNVAADAQAAAENAMDFGQLFFGMSFFLVAGALLLSALLTAFGIQQRRREMGLLTAVGFTRAQITRQLVVESGIVMSLGAVTGTAFSAVYSRLLLELVNDRWRGALAGTRILYRSTVTSYASGFLAITLMGVFAAALVVTVALGRRPLSLLRSSGLEGSPSSLKKQVSWTLWIGSSLLTAGAVIAIISILRTPDALAGPFFAVGGLLLAGAAFVTRYVLGRLVLRNRPPGSLPGLAIGGMTARPGRTTVVFALTATGCFLVFAVAGMTRNVSAGLANRNSGTGGFELFGESAIPIRPERTVDDPGGRFFGTFSGDQDFGFVPMKVRDGDDASCLNLNAAREPQILALDPSLLKRLSAFERQRHGKSVWDLLNPDTVGKPTKQERGEPNSRRDRIVIPALAGDIDTAAWGLRLRTHPEKGDVIQYTNSLGQAVHVKLVGRLPHRLTVFQGRLLVSVEDFARAFPGEDGFRAFLFDVPAGEKTEWAKRLRAEYGRSGLDLQFSSDRLEAFYRIEETYLRIFLVLGGIGVILGTVGLGIVALRNILERRAEFGLLQASGFPRPRICGLITLESLAAMAAGIGVGVIASATAIAPGLFTGATRPPLWPMIWIGVGISLNGLLWSVVAASWVLRLPLVASLRSE